MTDNTEHYENGTTDDDTAPEAAEEAAQTDPDASEDTAAVDDDAEESDHTHGDDSDESDDESDDDDEQPKKRGVRQKLRDAEVANERLTAAIARARDALVDAALDRAEVPPDQRRAVLRVVGDDELAECLDSDGLPDAELLQATVEAARAELGLPRRPRPNPNVGRREESSEPPTTFAGVLKQHMATRR